MTDFNIPNRDGQTRQKNVGDVYGELWATRNIDLTTSPGKIKLARPTEQIVTDTQLEGDRIEGIAVYGGSSDVHFLTDNHLYKISVDGTGFSERVAVSGGKDLISAFDLLLIPTDDDIASWNDSTLVTDYWTNTLSGTALDTNYPHNLHLSEEGQATLTVTDGPKIRYYRKTGTTKHFSINLLEQHIAISLASGSRSNWVGTYSTTGDNAFVYEWKVGNEEATEKYEVEARAVLAMQTLNDVPYLITERGELQKFNGVGFTTVNTLPIYNEPIFLDGVETALVQSNNSSRPVHPKGMKRFADGLLITINTEAVDGDNPNDRALSGNWYFNPANNSLHHLHGFDGDAETNSSAPLFTVNDKNGRVYFGGEKILSGSSDEVGLFRENLTADAVNYGYFVTTEMHADNFEDIFKSMFLSSLQDTSDKIVVKYREGKSLSLPIFGEATWLDGSTFNTTEDFSALSVGDEIEIMRGAGAGRCAHITEISASASTYSITLDTEIGTAGELFNAKGDNWAIRDTYTGTQRKRRIPINAVVPHSQYKVYMEGKNGYPEISRTTVTSGVKKPNK